MPSSEASRPPQLRLTTISEREKRRGRRWAGCRTHTHACMPWKTTRRMPGDMAKWHIHREPNSWDGCYLGALHCATLCQKTSPPRKIRHTIAPARLKRPEQSWACGRRHTPVTPARRKKKKKRARDARTLDLAWDMATPRSAAVKEASLVEGPPFQPAHCSRIVALFNATLCCTTPCRTQAYLLSSSSSCIFQHTVVPNPADPTNYSVLKLQRSYTISAYGLFGQIPTGSECPPFNLVSGMS